MNKNLKEFLHRGFIFSGLGPIVLGIVYTVLHFSIKLTLNGLEVFLGIVSTYLIAFIHAGSSVFHKIEHWSLAKSAGLQLALLYFSYLFFYLVNSWLEFNWIAIIIFTLAFVVGYLLILLIVFWSTKIATRKLNEKIK